MPGYQAYEHDVLIVGAGISGVGAAYHLSQQCPGKSFVVLEGDALVASAASLRPPIERSAPAATP